MKQAKLTQILFVIIFLLLSSFKTASSDQTNWLAIGTLHNWYSSVGCEIEVGRRHLITDQQDGLRWPAQFSYQDCQVAKALWIGTTNYQDPALNKTFSHKVVHVGTRHLNEVNEFMPQEFKLVGRYDHSRVFVDGQSASKLDGMETLDEIDVNLPTDRMIYNVVNTAIGITLTRKIYASGQQNHSNYFIYDYVFKNTGVVDNQGTVHEQTLNDVVFFFQYRYAVGREGGPYGSGSYFLPQNVIWGRNTMNEVIGEDPNSTDPFRALFSWHGKHSRWTGPGDNIGAPQFSTDGHLTAQQYVGVVTVHADKSVTDKSNDLFQPQTTWYLDSDAPITYNLDPFNETKMASEYAIMTSGHPPRSHAEEVGQGNADQWSQAGGGYSQTQGFGPYTLAPGDSIHIVLAEAVAGLSRDSCYTIGARWLSGTGPFKLPDGSTTADANAYKNAWVQTGLDSLWQTFGRAIDNYQSGLNIPSAPPPPSTFEVFSDTNKITLSWTNNAESWPKFSGYRVYRAAHKPDTSYQMIFACGPGSEYPEIVNTFEDTNVAHGISYYYYVVAFDDGSTNDEYPGTPLESSQFYTMTTEPAYLHQEIRVNADLYVAPTGNDNNSGLTADAPLRTISAALRKILAYQLQPHTIYLAAGNFSPSTTGESYPLIACDYVTLSGAGIGKTILDAENSANILHCINRENFAMQNLTIQNGAAEQGGGIYCENSNLSLVNVNIFKNSAQAKGGGIFSTGNSKLFLHAVTIKQNSAGLNGGGMYFDGNSNATFYRDQRSNIFLNTALELGDDLFNNSEKNIIHVVVDTFTVLTPSDYHCFPAGEFTFDILNYALKQTDADLYVNPNGDDDLNRGISASEPLRTLTRALKSIYADSLHPHTIHLAGGTYSPATTGEGFPLYARSYVSIVGAPEMTSVLDAAASARILHCDKDDHIVIENLILKNGQSEAGGGLLCRESNLVVKNTAIKNNKAKNFGGGIFCEMNSALTLSNVTVSENSTDCSGGGICFLSNSGANFDSQNRCNIFLNNAIDIGHDFYAADVNQVIQVVVDTFTVIYPTEEFAYPLDKFTFDILNYKIKQAAADLYLSPSGNDSNSGLSQSEPLKTIAYAMDLIFADSLTPRTIYLAEGVYSSTTNGEKLPLYGKSYISIRGAAESTTILDGQNNSRILEISDARDFIIEKLTIQNGQASNGAGIYCAFSNPHVKNVSFLSNTATDSGGAIYCMASDPLFQEVTFSKNRAQNGGALYATRSNPVLEQVTVVSDSAISGGGGFYFNSSKPVLKNVLMTSNYAKYGGGIYCVSSDVLLQNATLGHNNGTSRGGGIYSFGNSNIFIINSILWENTLREVDVRRLAGSNILTVAFSDLKGGQNDIYISGSTINWLEGNIAIEPLFVGAEPFDYHLTASSPCVDAGTDLFVWEGDTLVWLPNLSYQGSAPDLGAFESPYTSNIPLDVIIPDQFVLYQNYPNPFNPGTTIRYHLPYKAKVEIEIYDILGKQIRKLVDEEQTAGVKLIEWDARDEDGKPVASGLYLVRLQAGEYHQTRKMILVK